MLVVDDVHARAPRCGPVARPRAPRRSGRRPARPPPSVSPNRSSWIQSASPETPTPSRRTPPEVSRSAEQRRGRAGRRSAPLSVGEAQRGRAVEGGEVVQPHLDRDGAAGQPAACAAGSATSRGLPGEQARHQPAVGQVGVVGALDADRLGLPLGHDRPVVVGAGQLRRGRAVGLAEQPDQLVVARPTRGRRPCGCRPGAAARRWPGRRRG